MRFLIDTGYWFARLSKSDSNEYRSQIDDIDDCISLASEILLPWPTLYETLNTRFVEREKLVPEFERIIADPKYVKIDDSAYKHNCMSAVLKQKRRSLVDQILCAIMEEYSERIDVLVTFNPKDFIDVATKYQVEILPSPRRKFG